MQHQTNEAISLKFVLAGFQLSSLSLPCFHTQALEQFHLSSVPRRSIKLASETRWGQKGKVTRFNTVNNFLTIVLCTQDKKCEVDRGKKNTYETWRCKRLLFKPCYLEEDNVSQILKPTLVKKVIIISQNNFQLS